MIHNDQYNDVIHMIITIISVRFCSFFPDRVFYLIYHLHKQTSNREN